MSVSYPPHASHRNLLPPSLWQPVAGFTPPTPPSDAEKQQQQQLAGAVRVLWDRASSAAQLQAAIGVANGSAYASSSLANLVAATEARLAMNLVGQQVPRSTLSRKLQHGAWLGVWGMAHAESAWWIARSTRLSMVLLCMVLLSMAHGSAWRMALHGSAWRTGSAHAAAPARAQHGTRSAHGAACSTVPRSTLSSSLLTMAPPWPHQRAFTAGRGTRSLALRSTALTPSHRRARVSDAWHGQQCSGARSTALRSTLSTIAEPQARSAPWRPARSSRFTARITTLHSTQHALSTVSRARCTKRSTQGAASQLTQHTAQHARRTAWQHAKRRSARRGGERGTARATLGARALTRAATC